jgi:hypothetical protein
MRIEEVKVYKFEELTKEVQQKVIDRYYKNEDYPFLNDDLRESLRNNEENIFDDDFNLYYSLSYSQGDGLCIKGDIDIDKIMLRLSPELKEKFTGKIYKLYSSGNTGHYSFHSINDIKWELDLSDDDDHEELEKLFEEEVIPEIYAIYNSLCVDLRREGYSTLEYRMSIEEFTEFDELEYYEDGRMF